MEIYQLKSALHSALLGAIDVDVRAIAYNYVNHRIELYVYLDRTPKDYDYEIINIVISELMASVPEILSQKIEITEEHKPIGELNPYQGWLFVRYERS